MSEVKSQNQNTETGTMIECQTCHETKPDTEFFWMSGLMGQKRERHCKKCRNDPEIIKRKQEARAAKLAEPKPTKKAKPVEPAETITPAESVPAEETPKKPVPAKKKAKPVGEVNEAALCKSADHMPAPKRNAKNKDAVSQASEPSSDETHVEKKSKKASAKKPTKKSKKA
jgi:hypothetical protein